MNVNAVGLLETTVRQRVYEDTYFRESCFGCNNETIIDRIVELDHIGSSYGAANRPTRFLCVLTKLLQLNPSLEIVLELIHNPDFKYMTALACVYLRMVGRGVQIYQHLEPFFKDYRKLRYRAQNEWQIKHMDELIEELLGPKSHALALALPALPSRQIYVRSGQLQPRESFLTPEEEEIEADKRAEAKRAEKMRQKQLQQERIQQLQRQVDDEKSIDNNNNDGDGDGDSNTLGNLSGSKRKTREEREEDEFRQANEARAKLGLKPLRK